MLFSIKKHIIALEGFEKIIENFSTFLKYQLFIYKQDLRHRHHKVQKTYKQLFGSPRNKGVVMSTDISKAAIFNKTS